MTTFGIIGSPLQQSFSPLFFQNKFKKEHLDDYNYQLFPLNAINDLPALITQHRDLAGLNVTIPFKQSILPFLDKIDPTAEAIGAVNVVKIMRNGDTITTFGYNSDCIGFEKALLSFMPVLPPQVLILGSGGAAQAVAFTFKKLNVSFQFVSRKNNYNYLSYNSLTKEIIQNYPLIVNTTPLGMFPHISECPAIPYSFLSPNHYLFDLIYNPNYTLFMENGKKYGAHTCNGLEMLREQAEESWRIWQT